MEILTFNLSVLNFRSYPRETYSHLIILDKLDKFYVKLGFSGGSDGKESACNAGDLSSVPGLGRSPGGGQSNPLQYSCLENSMDRGAWQTTVHGVIKSLK